MKRVCFGVAGVFAIIWIAATLSCNKPQKGEKALRVSICRDQTVEKQIEKNENIQVLTDWRKTLYEYAFDNPLRIILNKYHMDGYLLENGELTYFSEPYKADTGWMIDFCGDVDCLRERLLCNCKANFYLHQVTNVDEYLMSRLEEFEKCNGAKLFFDGVGDWAGRKDQYVLWYPDQIVVYRADKELYFDLLEATCEEDRFIIPIQTWFSDVDSEDLKWCREKLSPSEEVTFNVKKQRSEFPIRSLWEIKQLNASYEAEYPVVNSDKEARVITWLSDPYAVAGYMDIFYVNEGENCYLQPIGGLEVLRNGSWYQVPTRRANIDIAFPDYAFGMFFAKDSIIHRTVDLSRWAILESGNYRFVSAICLDTNWDENETWRVNEYMYHYFNID